MSSKRPNIYQTLRRFLNSETIGDNIRVAAMCDATDGVEVVTGWKRSYNNPKYTTRMYVSALNKLGFITRIKQGVYRLNARIPDWCDLGVVWYATGYPHYDFNTRSYVLYHGKDTKQWKQTVKDYLNGFKDESPVQATSNAVAEPEPAQANHPKVDESPETVTFSNKSKLTDDEWIKLTKLFVNYCYDGMRAGQAYMNALHNVSPDTYDDVTASNADCFYDDDKIVAFIKYLNCGKLMKPQAKLGNHVKTKIHSHRGVVYQIHLDFSHTGESIDWLKGQKPAIDEKELHKPWVSILINNGGSVCVPMSDIDEITALTPTNINNPWFSFYFNE